MRRTFIICLFINAAVCLNDDLTEKITELLSMTKIDVQSCINKTNVKVEDAMKMDELINDNVETMDTDNAALKVGCLFACLFQRKGIMSGLYIDVNKIKELSVFEVSPINHTQSIIRDHILNTCNERVRSKTNECDVIIKFLMCIIAEIRKMYSNF